MSKCISAHGEYSSHEPGKDGYCTYCGDLDVAAHDAEVAAKTLRDAADASGFPNVAAWLRMREGA